MSRRVQFSKRGARIGISIVIFLVIFFLRNTLTRGLQTVQVPLSSLGTWVTQRMEQYKDARTLSVEEVAELRQYERMYLQLQAKYHDREREHEQLKKTLGFLTNRGVISIGGAVVSRTMTNERSLLVVNRGASDGVFVGAPVIVEEGLYVGKVMEVTPTQSIISAVTDREHVTAISLLNDVDTIGLIRGMNGNLALLEFIPLDETIQVDQIAVTSGLEEYVPSGLLIGLVNTVRPDPNGPFQQAIIEPIVDLRRYTSVVILLPSAL